MRVGGAATLLLTVILFSHLSPLFLKIVAARELFDFMQRMSQQNAQMAAQKMLSVAAQLARMDDGERIAARDSIITPPWNSASACKEAESTLAEAGGFVVLVGKS